ncbi:MAG: alpha-amylase family glycosyl hydrolase [Nitrososphaerales archaeon]
MSANLPLGAVEHSNGRVTFALYAPGKRSVHLVGDFNGWNPGADPLHAGPDGRWWIEKPLPAGSYNYQFCVDGDLLICDPYARELAEGAEHDPPRAIVTVGRPAYGWQHDDWSPPAFRDLVIMEIHVGDFTLQGNLQGVRDKLPYLRQLGINAIELMPIYEFRGQEGWGYNPAYFFTVETSYGGPDEMRRLVDEAHECGIGVILDLVLAHTAHRHPFNRLYSYEQSPWYGPGCGKRNEFGFPSLDYTKGPTQQFTADVQDYWLKEFHVDGFRYDYCWGIGTKEEMGVPYLVKTARAVLPAAYLIAEYSPEAPKDVNRAGMDGAWHVLGRYQLLALLREGTLNEHDWDDFEAVTGFLDPWQQGYRQASQMINFAESHDEQRLMCEVLEAGLDRAAAYRKSALAATVLFTMPGEPMLFHGQEWGEATPRLTNERNTLHWELLDTAEGAQLQAHYQQLAELRRRHPALRGEGFRLEALHPAQKTLVYRRWAGDGDAALVAVNFSPEAQEIPLPADAETWEDLLAAGSSPSRATPAVTLPGSTAGVYVPRRSGR